jgi:hypothetical protein
MTSRSLLLAAVLLFLATPSGLRGQDFTLPLPTYSITPTYQRSVVELNRSLVASDFQALGVMLGVDRPGHWWSPHAWVQRYELGQVTAANTPGGPSAHIRGWSVSVGPAIDLVNTPRTLISFMSHLGLDHRNLDGLTGGAGLHVGVKMGGFEPNAFGRLQVIRGYRFTTMGVGVRFTFTPEG